MPKEYTHSDFCQAAVRWLDGQGCNVSLSGISSTSEIPDAIGWSTCYKHYGSIVVECKISVSDFNANKHKKHGNRMGEYRYFLVPDGMISVEKLNETYPNHGLLYLRRGRVSIIQKSPRLENPDLLAERRLLQFALVHVKENLLGTGCAVDMSMLTKAYVSNRARNGWCGSKEFGYGIEYPQPAYTFNQGECK